jgi:hypothetical protein
LVIATSAQARSFSAKVPFRIPRAVIFSSVARDAFLIASGVVPIVRLSSSNASRRRAGEAR